MTLTLLFNVTASIGVASVIPDSQFAKDMLLEAADKAMYTSKNAGRNQVSSVLAICA